MNKDKKWEILAKTNFKNEKTISQKILAIVLKNRGLVKKEDVSVFLSPDIHFVTTRSVGIDEMQFAKTVKRIRKAIMEKEQIIIFGDYDVDGICGTAILWETLNALGANVSPYIPQRIEEGYGLSIAGIENVLQQHPQTKVITTVDNGIVANNAVDFACSKNIDVIITDHHVVGDNLPKAYSIVHTTQLCGAGVAWILSEKLKNVMLVSEATPESGSKKGFEKAIPSDHLALVALATVADLVPLVNANRNVLSKGLKVLHATKRPGIRAICEEANIDQEKIGVYEIGHIVGPRLNAMGRIASAMDSLRLLCTKDGMRAKVLAEKLGQTNKDRQELTKNFSDHAINFTNEKKEKLLFVAQESYEEGVIGLVAGRLVETYYRPAIVVAKREKISKASARSIAGFNIIEFIRSASHLLINAGGHPMAAGFTIATENITKLEAFFLQNIAKKLPDELLVKKIKIDCELPLEHVSQNVYDTLQQLQPFGMRNPDPIFIASDIVKDIKKVGQEGKHLRLVVGPDILNASEESYFRNKEKHTEKKRSFDFVQDDNILDFKQVFRSSLQVENRIVFSAIAFGLGKFGNTIQAGDVIQIAYTIDENIWKDKKTLQLKIKDMKLQQ